MTKLFKYLTLGVFLFVLQQDCNAQQDPQFTQYYFNPLATNSAYAGTRDALSMNLLVREQWLGIEGRPRTQTLSIHTPLAATKLAAGLNFIADQHGPVKSTYLNGDLAYGLKVGENSTLSLGLRAGFHLYRAGLSGLETNEDSSFQGDITSEALPNFGVSSYWYSETHFVGLSIPRLIENDYFEEISAVEVPLEKRHMFLTAGKVFTLNSSLKLKPTLFVKYVKSAPVSIDVSANLLIQEKLWVGSFLRLQDAVGLLISYQLKDSFRVGYSYDKTISSLSGFTSGSHEILLNYDLKLGKEKALSPRYF